MGINYKGTSYALAGCVNDARNLKTLLTTKFGYPEANVKLMVDEGVLSSSPLYPTAANICAALDQLTTGLGPGDVVLFSVSSHGLQYTDRTQDELDGKDEAILARDGRAILDDTLRTKVAAAAACGAKIRIFIDTCHSGTMIDLPYRVLGGSVSQEGPAWSSMSDVIMFSGAKDSEYAADAYINRQAQGALSYGINYLLGTPASPSSFKWADVLAALRVIMLNYQFAQEPQMNVSRLDLLDDPVDL